MNENIGPSFLTFFNWINGIWLSFKGNRCGVQRMGPNRSFYLKQLDSGVIASHRANMLISTETALDVFLPDFIQISKEFIIKRKIWAIK